MENFAVVAVELCLSQLFQYASQCTNCSLFGFMTERNDKFFAAPSAAQVVYTLTIRGVWEQPFQVACTDCRPTFHGYRFEARYAGDGCEARVCAPGLDPDATPSLRGDALVFRGDVYTDTHEVRSVDDLPPGNDDLFNMNSLARRNQRT